MHNKDILGGGVSFSVGITEVLYLDKWLYRGKGRPRTKDYSTLATLQRKLNAELAKRMDAQMFEIKEPSSA